MDETAMTTTAILEAINAYADAQQRESDTRSWLALTHRSNRSAAADEARAIRDAGRDALDVIQDWPKVEQRADGPCVLQAPDGTRVLYFCERKEGCTCERLAIMDDCHPTYHTTNGTPIPAYVVEAVGQSFSIDGGETNLRGTHGILGSYVTASEAIAVATEEKNETCEVRVLNTRADEEPRVIFEA